jgi:teichoic acid transport system permease protein
VLPYLGAVWERRSFAVELARTRLRAQHFNTVFGQFWLVLNPLLLTAVYFVLVDILRAGDRGENFFAHLMAGIFAYYFVSGAVRNATGSVVSSGRLILNTAFPRLLLPLASVVIAFKRFIPTMVVYVPVHVALGLPIGPGLLWIVPLVDLLRVWLYGSPVLYYASEMPEQYRFVLDINPLGQLLAAWSEVLNQGGVPTSHQLLVSGAWAFGFLLVGFVYFISREREFAFRL